MRGNLLLCEENPFAFLLAPRKDFVEPQLFVHQLADCHVGQRR